MTDKHITTTARRRPIFELYFDRGKYLRGYGNSVVPQVAAAFVKAFMNIN